jgi:hypothetical protein
MINSERERRAPTSAAFAAALRASEVSGAELGAPNVLPFADWGMDARGAGVVRGAGEGIGALPRVRPGWENGSEWEGEGLPKQLPIVWDLGMCRWRVNGEGRFGVVKSRMMWGVLRS